MSSEAASGPLPISAIPDQDPEVLNRLYGDVASRFSDSLGLDVRYTPVTEYPAVVRAFEVGDIYLAWMGGLTGVQATARVPEAKAIAQRDIDADFHSLFIATKGSGIAPFEDTSGLSALAGHSFTFGRWWAPGDRPRGPSRNRTVIGGVGARSDGAVGGRPRS